jgi:hypothetical protein
MRTKTLKLLVNRSDAINVHPPRDERGVVLVELLWIREVSNSLETVAAVALDAV